LFANRVKLLAWAWVVWVVVFAQVVIALVALFEVVQAAGAYLFYFLA
jgi:hypothetical protein